MTTAGSDLNLAGTIFVAINRALEAALRAADAASLPPKTRQAFDRLDGTLDKIHAEFRRIFWIIGGLLVAVVAYLTFLFVTS